MTTPELGLVIGGDYPDYGDLPLPSYSQHDVQPSYGRRQRSSMEIMEKMGPGHDMDFKPFPSAPYGYSLNNRESFHKTHIYSQPF